MTEQGDLPTGQPDSDSADEAEHAGPYRPDPANDPHPGVPDHLAPDDAGERPWIDPSKDPTPGRPGHLAPDDDS